MRRIWLAVASAAAAGHVLLQFLGRQAGSTQKERQRRLPGDELVPRPQIVTDHAVTLDVASADARPASGARLHLRVRGTMAPRWFARIYQLILVPADYVMALGMLRGIAKRAEAHESPRPSGRIPYSPVTEVTT